MSLTLMSFPAGKNNPLATCYQAATNSRIMKHSDFQELPVSAICDLISEATEENDVPFRILSRVTLGAVKIFEQQINFLYEQTSELLNFNSIFFKQALHLSAKPNRKRTRPAIKPVSAPKKLKIDPFSQSQILYEDTWNLLQEEDALQSTSNQFVNSSDNNLLPNESVKQVRFEDITIQEVNWSETVGDWSNDFGGPLETQPFQFSQIIRRRRSVVTTVRREIVEMDSFEIEPPRSQREKEINNNDSDFNVNNMEYEGNETNCLTRTDTVFLSTSSRIYESNSPVYESNFPDISNIIPEQVSFQVESRKRKLIETEAQIPHKQRKSFKKRAFDTYTQLTAKKMASNEDYTDTLRCLNPFEDTIHPLELSLKKPTVLFKSISRRCMSKRLTAQYEKSLLKQPKSAALDDHICHAILNDSSENISVIMEKSSRGRGRKRKFPQAENETPAVLEESIPLASVTVESDVMECNETSIPSFSAANKIAEKCNGNDSYSAFEDRLSSTRKRSSCRKLADVVRKLKKLDVMKLNLEFLNSKDSKTDGIEAPLKKKNFEREKIVRQLLIAWQDDLDVLDMKYLFSALKFTRKSVALAFLIIIELSSLNFIKLSKHPEKNEITNIQMGEEMRKIILRM